MNNFSEAKKKFLRQHLYNKNLSKCEVEVVILVLQGLINREVANRLCVAEKTVKFHLTNAYKKLNISRRSEIVWTLPLAEFVGVEEQKRPEANTGKNNIASGADNSSAEELALPIGSRTEDISQ